MYAYCKAKGHTKPEYLKRREQFLAFCPSTAGPMQITAGAATISQEPFRVVTTIKEELRIYIFSKPNGKSRCCDGAAAQVEPWPPLIPSPGSLGSIPRFSSCQS